MPPATITRYSRITAVPLATAFLLLFSAGYSPAGDVQSTICNNQVVSVGNMKGEVLAKCGKPLSKFAGETEDRGSSSRTPTEKGKKVRLKKTKGARGVETWTYNIDGSYRFFIFRGGRLERIETGGLVN